MFILVFSCFRPLRLKLKNLTLTYSTIQNATDIDWNVWFNL